MTNYVLPRFENRKYLEIKTGEHFGHIDLGDDPFISDSQANSLKPDT